MRFLIPLLLCLNLHAATYYFDYVYGLDSNNGTSTNTPWQHHPYSTNFGGSYTHSVGDQFVFKGGVAVTNGFPILLQAGGTGSTYDIYTSQSNWFTNASFTRPVLNGLHLVTNCIGIYGISNVVLSNLDIFGVACSKDNEGCVAFWETANLIGVNLHLHDWLSSVSGSGTDTLHGGWIGYDSNTGWGFTNIVLTNSEVDNVENGPSGNWNGVCVLYGGILGNCLIHDNGCGVAYAQDFNYGTISNIAFPYSDYDPMFHENGFYMDGGNWTSSVFGGTIYFRNSLIANCGGGANMAYPCPEHFNCVIYNDLFVANPAMSGQQAINCDPDPGGFGNIGYTIGGCYVGNCTIWMGTNNFMLGIQFAARSGATTSVAQVYNNLIIGTNASVTNGTITAYPHVTNYTQLGNLALTPTSAAAYGITLANNFTPTQAIPMAGQNNSAFYSIDLAGNNYTAGPYPWNPGAYEWLSAGISFVPGGTLNLVPGSNAVNIVP